MIRSRLILPLLLIGLLSLIASAAAHDGEDHVVVLDIAKPADQRLMDWVAETLSDTEAHLFVLQIDSPGITSGDPTAMYEAITTSPAPVVAWIGAAPAVARGGIASVLNLADRGAAAPGVRFGYLEPMVANGSGTAPLRPDRPAEGATNTFSRSEVVVAEPVPGYIDDVVPSVGQLIVGLDGVVLTRPDGTHHTISTAATRTIEDGTEVTVPSRVVEFRKPSLLDRVLRLASKPETAFFFLVSGIAVATFEFYAAGVGVTAAAAVISLFLAGYGMATLPMNWPAVAASVVGLFAYNWDFQRGRIGWRSVVGTGLLLAGGLNFTTALPQFGPVPWVVVTVVIGAALFYGFALTAIARSRYSTPTIGREGLVGRSGVAETDFTPEGVVNVDGARWRGRSHREAGIKAGDSVVVASISGIVLEVDPAPVDEGVRD